MNRPAIAVGGWVGGWRHQPCDAETSADNQQRLVLRGQKISLWAGGEGGGGKGRVISRAGRQASRLATSEQVGGSFTGLMIVPTATSGAHSALVRTQRGHVAATLGTERWTGARLLRRRGLPSSAVGNGVGLKVVWYITRSHYSGASQHGTTQEDRERKREGGGEGGREEGGRERRETRLIAAIANQVQRRLR